MKQITNNLKFMAIFLFLVLGVTLIAQDKNDFETKMKSLKGKVEKVTVKVDGKDVMFEGDEAERITKLFSAGGNIMFMSKKDAKADGKEYTVVLKSNGKDDETEKEIKKKLEFDVIGGAKKIKITTIKDGKEETKVYEGEEAEKFLKENGKGKTYGFKIDKEDGDDKEIQVYVSGDDAKLKDHMIWVGKSKKEDGDCSCCKCCNNESKHSKMTIRKFDKDSDEVEVIIKKLSDDDKAKKEVKKEVKKEEKK